MNQEAKDLAAFIALALRIISDGIDVSVAAWEKRDYWIKADKFRMEWVWSGQVADKMKVALFTDDWGTVAMLSAQIAQKFNKIVVSDNHRLGKPWVGAYKQLTSTQCSASADQFAIKEISEVSEISYLILNCCQSRQMHFRIIQQLDHHLADVSVEIMILQRGERQEARACNDVNAIR